LPKVFLDDISGLPPKMEIKFVVDLAPGVERISKAPYRMTPIEMKELVIQLQDF